MSRVKICGLRRVEDIEAVNRALPDFAGFVFADSRRQVSARRAAELREKLDERIKAVGVFVNQEMETITGLCRDRVIDLIQLHGDEDREYILRLREKSGCPVIKTVSIGDTPPIIPEGPDYLLFDTASELRGGAGRVFDWGLLADYKGPPYFLAGGLTLENTGEAIGRLSPFCVDVSSGVETGGWKDSEKIDSFVRLVRRTR